jgi:hypothetical protein
MGYLAEREQQDCICIEVKPKLPERKRRFNYCPALEVNSGVVKSWIKPVSGYRTGNQFVDLACAQVTLEIRRKGKDELIETYNPFSVDNEKGLSFYWTPLFLAQAPGYYIGDILVNGVYCFSLNFRFRKCELAAVECFSEFERPCVVPCADTIGAAGCSTEVCTPQDVIGTESEPTDPCAVEVEECGAKCDGAIGSGYIGAEDE